MLKCLCNQRWFWKVLALFDLGVMWTWGDDGEETWIIRGDHNQHRYGQGWRVS